MDAHPVQPLADMNDDAVIAFVFEQHVAAVAQHEEGNALRTHQIQHVHEFSQAARGHIKIRRASAAETRMKIHGFVFEHPVFVGIVQ